MAKLILFNKPFGVLSQFRQDSNNSYATLGDYFDDKSLRVAGRLDATSEGLLLLTDDGRLNQRLTEPKLARRKAMPKPTAKPTTQMTATLNVSDGKTYWVQVAGVASDEQISQLAAGVALQDGKTMPALVSRLGDDDIARLWQAPNGVAYRKITSWLAITLFEGKNRQIRRMTASVGLPCLRLVRVAVQGYSVFDIAVGESVCLVV